MSHVKRRRRHSPSSPQTLERCRCDDRATVGAKPGDVGQQALIRGFTHVRVSVWGCLVTPVRHPNRGELAAYPGNPRYRIEGESPLQGKGHTVFETHRSAAVFVETDVPGCAAMLLSMRPRETFSALILQDDGPGCLALFLLSRPPRFRRRLVHHALELHPVGVGEVHRVIAVVVILAGRIDHRHTVLGEESAEFVHVLSARQLERIVMEADVALAVLVLLAARVGLGDPEQRLAVAPAGHVGVVVLELEAEEAEQLAVEVLRALEVADAEDQVIDADDAGHGISPNASSWPDLFRPSTS